MDGNIHSYIRSVKWYLLNHKKKVLIIKHTIRSTCPQKAFKGAMEAIAKKGINVSDLIDLDIYTEGLTFNIRMTYGIRR